MTIAYQELPYFYRLLNVVKPARKFDKSNQGLDPVEAIERRDLVERVEKAIVNVNCDREAWNVGVRYFGLLGDDERTPMDIREEFGLTESQFRTRVDRFVRAFRADPVVRNALREVYEGKELLPKYANLIIAVYGNR